MANQPDPYSHLDPKLAAVMRRVDKTLSQQSSMQSRGSVTGGPVQNTGATVPPLAKPSAPTTAAPSPWQHFLNWLGFGSVPQRKAQATSLTQGAAYLADGGKSRARSVNDAIDEASK